MLKAAITSSDHSAADKNDISLHFQNSGAPDTIFHTGLHIRCII